jgi:glycosyltransferase involved in cell wall biosynthesis
MMPEGPRLYYLDDIPTPYRLGLQKLVADRWPGTFRLGFCAESEPGREWQLDFGAVDVEFLPGRQFSRPTPANPFQIKWNPGVAKSLAAWKPDVVILSGYTHPTMWRAARWCIRNGVPYGVSCETSLRSAISTSGWRWALKRALAGWVVRKMAFGLPVGREAADYLRKFGPTDAPMRYFPNTPDTAPIIAEADRIAAEDGEAALRSQFGIPAEAAIFLFVGRLIDVKRPLDAVRAFRKLHGDAALVIIGDGDQMAAVREAADGDPRVICAGWVKEPELIFGLMAIATALILPSQSETWGAVVNEAMAAGTPVISSDKVGAAVELIQDGENGYLVPVGDVSGYESAMQRLTDDPELAAGLGRAARETAIAQGEEFAAANLIEGALAAARLDRR